MNEKDKLYNEVLELLGIIKDNGRIRDFCFYSYFQPTYIYAIISKQIRVDNGVERIRKPNLENSKEIVTKAKRFIKKENLK